MAKWKLDEIGKHIIDNVLVILLLDLKIKLFHIHGVSAFEIFPAVLTVTVFWNVTQRSPFSGCNYNKYSSFGKHEVQI